MSVAHSEGHDFSIVCISSQTWHVDLPTNRQQIMRRAARRGHSVLFVESGSFYLRGVSNIFRRPREELRKRLTGEQVEDGIRAQTALNIIPWGKRYQLASRINFALTALLLRRRAKSLPQPVVLWLYDPSGAQMAGSLGEAFAVYDCVDDYAEQYAADRRKKALVAAADQRAARSARLVFATTESLVEKHRRTNPRTYLVPNAADYDHFSRGAAPEARAEEVQNLRPPVIGFAGNLTEAKVDFELLETLAVRRPDWSLLLIGPVQSGAEACLARLTKLPNVHWLGWRPYDELPRYVAAFDVGLCPYSANAYTRSVFPLKVYEYLAAGKPVVATGTPSLRGLEPDVVLVEDQTEVFGAVEAALERVTASDRARRSALAAANTWDRRTERLLQLISTELAALGRG